MPFNPISQEEVDKAATNWNSFLKSVEEKLTSYTEKELIFVQEDLNDFINLLMGIRHGAGLNIPQDFIIKANELIRKIEHLSMGKNGEKWNKYLMEKIRFLKQILNDKRKLDKEIIRDVLTNYVKIIKESFDVYKKVFNSENTILKEESERVIAQLEGKYGISLVNYEPFEIETIDSDKLLDLYEEIQKMKPGKEKEEKEKQLQRWQKQLVSFIKSKKIISSRDKNYKEPWKKIRRDWGNIKPIEKIHKTGPKENEEKRKEIEKGLREYYEQD